MGYELHITRRQKWFDEAGPDIGLEEWQAYVESDPDMRMDNFAEAATPEGTLRYENEGLAAWTCWPNRDSVGGEAWFNPSDGNVVVKNPDASIIKKMVAIADALGARVQGDEGEEYDADGNSNWAEIREIVEPEPKPW